jgi:hypothetical protein
MATCYTNPTNAGSDKLGFRDLAQQAPRNSLTASTWMPEWAGLNPCPDPRRHPRTPATTR